MPSASYTVTPYDVAATVYEALGIDLAALAVAQHGREVPMLPVGKPIPNVL